MHPDKKIDSEANMDVILQAFQRSLREDEKSPRTIAAYVGDVRDFLAGIHKSSLDALTKQDVLAYKERLEADYAVATRNRKLVSLSRFLAFARGQDLSVPPLPIKFFDVHHQHINWYVTESEVQRLIKEAEKQEDWRAAALFAGLFYSGARVSELLQISTHEATQKVVPIVGKGKKARNLYLSNEVLRRTWQRYRATKQDETCPFFFSGRRGRLTRQTVSTIIRQYAGQVRPRLKREKAHAHAFRHGCGMWLKKKGHSIDQVADILGHRSLETTRIYFRDTEEDLLRIMQ